MITIKDERIETLHNTSMHIRRRRFLLILFTYVWGASTPLFAATLPIESDLVGQTSVYTIKAGDSLPVIARRFDIGILELRAANPHANAAKPFVGTKLIIPTAFILPDDREGIVINLAELRLYYFTKNNTVMTFPIGIGREGWLTPLAMTIVTKKRKDPTWTPPASIRAENPALPDVVPAGPDNPLGQYALTIGIPSYAIHGTNRPYAVGKRSSHGCIRLYPEDIEVLFNAVDVGVSVTIIDAPYNVGRKNDTIFLETHPLAKPATIASDASRPSRTDIPSAIKNRADKNTAIDWARVTRVMSDRKSIPVAVGKGSVQ